MRKIYAHYKKLVPTQSLTSLPVTDIRHVIKEINKQRHVAWRIEETRLLRKEQIVNRYLLKRKHNENVDI